MKRASEVAELRGKSVEEIYKRVIRRQEMAQVKVTLTRSLIGRPEDQRATVKALGLKKTNSQVVKEVTPQIEGMLHKVRHLVKVEEV